MTTIPQFQLRVSYSQFRIKLFGMDYVVPGRTVLLIIIIVAVILRLVSAFYQGNNIVELPGISDQFSYDRLARRVADGYGFSFAEIHWPVTRGGEPTAHWSYLYTLYLVAVYKIFGTYPLVARIIQALFAGIFQTILIMRIGSRLFNHTVGLIAAALNAVYIYFFYYAGALITETFYISCILWIFDASFRLISKDSKITKRIQWLELGLAIGLTVLLRQVFLVFLPFLFIWIWWNLPHTEIVPWKRKLNLPALKGLAISTAVLVIMILPFTIRNYRAFGTFVLLNTNAGFAFYWGNHPIHGTHFIPLLPDTGPSYADLIPPQLLSLNEGMLDKTLLREGVRIVLNDPVRYIMLSFSRIEEYIKFWPSKDSSLISNISRVGSFGILLPFMLYGLLNSFSSLKKSFPPRQGTDIVIVYLFIITYASIHLFTWTLIRYRLPIDAFLILFAAAGVENLVKKNQLRLKT